MKPAMDVATLLPALAAAAEAGAMRRLDAAFARFLHDRDAQADTAVLLAGALVAHLDGQGHVCLPLAADAEPGSALAAALPWVAPPLRPLLRPWQSAGAMPATAAGWLQLLRRSPLVHVAGDQTGAHAATPLVLDGSRLYLRRHWRDECKVALQLHARARNTRALAPDRVRLALQALFPHLRAVGSDRSTSADDAFDGQAAACVLALRSGISLLTGGPGTGKTYTAARLLALAVALEDPAAPLRIALAAPTGKAAARLRQSIAAALDALVHAGGPASDWAATLAERLSPARTLHALLGARPDTRHFRHGAGNPLPVDLLLVDEASMVHLGGMAALLDAVAPDTRLVLLGDQDQLASVEAGAVLADLCAGAEQGAYEPETAALLQACTGHPVPQLAGSAPGTAAAVAVAPVLNRHTVRLRHSHRFGGPIGELALAANAGHGADAQALLRAGQDGVLQWVMPATRAAVLALALHGREGLRSPAGDQTSAGTPEAAGHTASARANAASNGNTPVGHGQALRTLQAWATARQAQAVPAADTVDTVLASHASSDGSEASRLATPRLDDIAALLRAFDRFRILCAVQEGPWGVKALNLAVEQALAQAGLIHPLQPWYPGRPVMVTRNDAAAGVFNGDIGLVLPPLAPGAAVRAAFADGPGVRLVAVSRLPEVETAFVMTVHKAQGSEFEHTALVLPPEAGPGLTRELVYTGITRARSAFTLLTPRPQVLAQALAQRSLRASGLAQRLRAGQD